MLYTAISRIYSNFKKKLVKSTKHCFLEAFWWFFQSGLSPMMQNMYVNKKYEKNEKFENEQNKFEK